MKAFEIRLLTTGDRVTFTESDGTVEGVVTAVDHKGVSIQWPGKAKPWVYEFKVQEGEEIRLNPAWKTLTRQSGQLAAASGQ